jgi:hypothetical protein
MTPAEISKDNRHLYTVQNGEIFFIITGNNLRFKIEGSLTGFLINEEGSQTHSKICNESYSINGEDKALMVDDVLIVSRLI